MHHANLLAPGRRPSGANYAEMDISPCGIPMVKTTRARQRGLNDGNCQNRRKRNNYETEAADGKCSERLFVSAADLSPLDTFTRKDGTSPQSRSCRK